MDFFSLSLPGPGLPARSNSWPEADVEASWADHDAARSSAFAARPRIADLPFPEPKRDDERIENALWLLENNPSGRAPRTTDEPDDDWTSFGPANLFGLIGSANAQARGGWGKPPSVRLDPSGQYPAEMPVPELPPSPQDLFRQELHHYRWRQLQALEPDNPLLQGSPPRLDRVPTVEEIDAVGRERDAAYERARKRGLGMPAGRGGESESTITGRAAHREYANKTIAEGDRANVRIGRGRADRLQVDEAKKKAHVIELKSIHPPSVRRGKRQGAGYARDHEQETGMPTTSSVETYDPVELILRMLGLRK